MCVQIYICWKSSRREERERKKDERRQPRRKLFAQKLGNVRFRTKQQHIYSTHRHTHRDPSFDALFSTIDPVHFVSLPLSLLYSLFPPLFAVKQLKIDLKRERLSPLKLKLTRQAKILCDTLFLTCVYVACPDASMASFVKLATCYEPTQRDKKRRKKLDRTSLTYYPSIGSVFFQYFSSFSLSLSLWAHHCKKCTWVMYTQPEQDESCMCYFYLWKK